MLTDNIPHRITGRENLLAVLQEHLVRDTRVATADRDVFLRRLPQQLPRIVTSLSAVYGSGPEIWDVVARAVLTAWDAYAERPADLRDLDRQREGAAPWFTSREAVGGVCYVDRYAGTIAGLREQIPYFRELGLSYLHLMPLYESPAGNSDGGYAVSSYRRVDPTLGTMDELAELAAELRSQGIALVLDFVFNHTSNEHEWARAAAAGDPHFERFYWIHRDRTLPDAFERTAREIFPDDHPGVFTRVDSTPAGRAASPFDPDPRWVWTTFHRFQWDLNYANPEVFHAMAGEMLFLANQGAQVLRLDAVAFIWKQLGTTCESQPQVHDLLRAFRAVAALAAPAVEFKSEAIVHPDEVIRYVHPEQCALSYNPLQMALTWEALATRDVTLLSAALAERHETPEGTAWVNYVRGHDDIGWTFSDDDAARLGVDPAGHRRFLNAFYTGRHPGSFADGVAFQDNPRTGDCRICGTTASLLGLEAEPGPAVDRILLAHSLAMSTGGVPLVYLGDEVGQLNDPHWSQEPGARSRGRRPVGAPPAAQGGGPRAAPRPVLRAGADLRRDPGHDRGAPQHAGVRGHHAHPVRHAQQPRPGVPAPGRAQPGAVPGQRQRLVAVRDRGDAQRVPAHGHAAARAVRGGPARRDPPGGPRVPVAPGHPGALNRPRRGV